MFEDPMGIAVSAPFRQMILEKVRFGVQTFMSRALIEELTIRPELHARHLADHLAYMVEGVVYGREARERVVDRRTEKSEEEVKSPVITTVNSSRSFPKTWQDQLKSTLVGWAYRRSIDADDKATENELDEDSEEYRLWRPPLGVRVRKRFWRKAYRLVLRFAGNSQKVTVDVRTTHVTNVRITPITKHIEIHKHWHTCPHLDISARGPHITFLMDEAKIGGISG